jgi:uncharacterized protein YbjQ (UPF0145 family)
MRAWYVRCSLSHQGDAVKLQDTRGAAGKTTERALTGAALIGALCLSACAPSQGVTVRSAQPDGEPPIERSVDEVELWVQGGPSSDVMLIGDYETESTWIVGPRCSKRQRHLYELGARLEALEGLRQAAAASGADGLLGVRCKAAHTLRSFEDRCSATAFRYAGDQRHYAWEAVPSSVHEGPLAVRTATVELATAGEPGG